MWLRPLVDHIAVPVVNSDVDVLLDFALEVHWFFVQDGGLMLAYPNVDSYWRVDAVKLL